jgi:YesN/AraC family two-component response regulator
MYKVMLVDDDYPVLEFLSEMINWEDLGLQLQSVHGNGLSALIEAEENMPDILITDIGMPKLNGIELTKKLKVINSSLLIAILSCHNEFHFAQQALKLNVQEYIVKDNMNVEDIVQLLRKFVETLDTETKKKRNQLRLVHTIEQNKGLLLERFIHKTIHHPIHSEETWAEEAHLLGLQPNQNNMVILCFIDHYQSVIKSFCSTELVHFLVHNVITELITNEHINAMHGQFYQNESFLFVPLNQEWDKETQKIKIFLQMIQETFQKTFGISLLFEMGRPATRPNDIKEQMVNLIDLKDSRNRINNEIASACKYISDNIHRKINMEEVAQYLHLNSSYFSRLFKKEVGETFVKYVVNMKMNRAKELLDQTNYSILEISELLGYDNQSYFNKTFKGSEGISPNEYRNRLYKREMKI